MADNSNNPVAGLTPLPDEKNNSQGSGGIPFAQTGVKHIAITHADIEKFGIDEAFVKKNPALVELILKTESMKDEERKYWFQLLPIMSEEQVKKLANILQNERDQLEELDKKYENEVAKLNQTQASWNPEKFKNMQKENAAQEQASEMKEEDAAKDILDQLENM
ncbi:hypothetical protein K9N08_01310 [Candidatus Gracilibacteria bacterium]|nr:hypothetical protein [Candidatus Gracilibacteria bacterium]MCF7856179.1 hypothetical protein [Candidatus Gracilibacteria bacterium]MCF7896451.1 hypothetical protein [Candidatus Gracilibacteria bacterium]